MTETNSNGLGDDLLLGAAEISNFIFGTPARRRGVYHLVATSRLPIFRLGSQIAARRSTIAAWIEGQERQSQRDTALIS
jgi:hypothetical protein